MSKTKFAVGYALVFALTTTAAADILPPRPQPIPDTSRTAQPSQDETKPAAPSTEKAKPVPPQKGDTGSRLVGPDGAVAPTGRSMIAIAVAVIVAGATSSLLIFSGSFRRRRSPPAAT